MAPLLQPSLGDPVTWAAPGRLWVEAETCPDMLRYLPQGRRLRPAGADPLPEVQAAPLARSWATDLDQPV